MRQVRLRKYGRQKGTFCFGGKFVGDGVEFFVRSCCCNFCAVKNRQLFGPVLWHGVSLCCTVLDPMPTSLLFECSDQVVPLLTTIVNQSLATGIFRSCMKSAVVKPLMKKTTKKPHLTQMCLNSSGLFQFALCVQTHWETCSWPTFPSSRPQQYLAHLPISLSPKTQYRDSSPSCLKRPPDCFWFWVYLYSDSSGSKRCLRHNRT